MRRWKLGVLWLSTMFFAFGSTGQAQSPHAYQLAVGTIGTDSYVFGTELWAAAQINLLPSQNLAIEPVAVDDEKERLLNLSDGVFDFALVSDEANPNLLGDLKAVMAFWPKGIDKVDAPATQLLVHPETPYGVVYHLTRLIFEHAGNLRSAHATIGIGSLRSAIVGLELPMHPGALRYYEERGLGVGRRAAGSAPGEAGIVQTNKPEVSDDILQEIKPLGKNCRQAVTHQPPDYRDGNNRFDSCDPESPSIAGAGTGWPSAGKGGPRVIPGQDDEIDWRNSSDRAPSPHNRTQGLQPTM